MLTGTIPVAETADLLRAEQRLPRWMAALAAAGTLLACLLEGLRFGAGFAGGAALALLNYYWLHQAVVTLFSAGQSRVPWRVVAKFALRYPLAIAVLYLAIKFGWVPFTAILAGLFVPVAGVLVEAINQLASGWKTSSDN